MKVKEFSDKIGLPSSKIRFYDRSQIIKGGRVTQNNYRTFNELDALQIYNAQMLRSFNISVPDVLIAQNENLTQLNRRVLNQLSDLERTVREQEMHLARLKEMKKYFEMITEHNPPISYHNLEDSYNICTLNNKSSADELNTVKILAEVMPFSYICIRISKESVLKKETPLDISIGLGILQSNKEKLGLKFPESIKKDKKRSIIQLLLETQNPFNLTCNDLEPLMRICSAGFISATKKMLKLCTVLA